MSHDWQRSGGYSEDPADGGIPVWTCTKCGGETACEEGKKPSPRKKVRHHEFWTHPEPTWYTCDEYAVYVVMAS